MAATHDRIIIVFGGTGFLGRRVVRRLREREFFVRIATRHPDQGRGLFGVEDQHLQSIEADVRDERSIANVVAGAYAVVNSVSLYIERGQETFHSVHVECAQRVAAQAHQAGVERLAHVSGIGADPASPSLYIRKRGEGEVAVRAAFANATLIRPAVMFGPDDAFLTTVLKLLRKLPIYPMFGSGLTRLQPAHVEDVAEAIVRALQRMETNAITYECGGPRVYSYEEFLRAVAQHAGLGKPTLVPVPFAAWYALAWIAGMLPSPPVTQNQVELMQFDNVSSPLGFHRTRSRRWSGRRYRIADRAVATSIVPKSAGTPIHICGGSARHRNYCRCPKHRSASGGSRSTFRLAARASQARLADLHSSGPLRLLCTSLERDRPPGGGRSD